ncbi:MAG: zinc-ribbon domain-containing protein [Candidatus Kariarchaeaceae archaeon]|jgi:DNA-directed RNA polymerase subunit RPC12/RpoP
MMDRKRFSSTWNGVATIVFIGGIFLGFEVLGYSAFLFAIFLWAIGGIVTNMIYGPKKETRKSVDQIGVQKDQDRSCPSCGSKLDQGSNFCSECGTSIEIPAK